MGQEEKAEVHLFLPKMVKSQYQIEHKGQLKRLKPRGCLRFVIAVFPDHTHLQCFTEDHEMSGQKRLVNLYSNWLPNYGWRWKDGPISIHLWRGIKNVSCVSLGPVGSAWCLM